MTTSRRNGRYLINGRCSIGSLIINLMDLLLWKVTWMMQRWLTTADRWRRRWRGRGTELPTSGSAECGVREWLRWPPHRKWPATSVTLGCTHVLKKNPPVNLSFHLLNHSAFKELPGKRFRSRSHSFYCCDSIHYRNGCNRNHFGVWLIVVGLMTLWRGLLSSCPNTIRPIKRVRLSGQSINQSINHSYANCMN